MGDRTLPSPLYQGRIEGGCPADLGVALENHEKPMIGPDLEQFAEDLSAYLDDELSPEERQAVEEKLRANAQARKLLEDLQTTSKIVNALPRHAAPASVVDDLNTQLERSELLAGFDEAETTVVTERPGWFPKLSMAAMIGIVAVGGWWMVAGPGSSTSKPGQDQYAQAKKSSPETSVGTRRDRGARATSTTTTGALAKTKSLDTADVETKLAAGVAPQALRKHAFANEPIRLIVPVRYESEQASVLAKIAQKLASANAKDLATQNAANQSTAGAFFYRGKPGVNYKKGATRQILVRATRSQLDAVLREVKASRNPSSVRLKAGALTLKGSRKASDTLTMLASPDSISETNGADRSRAQEKLLDDVLVSLGVDPSSFRTPANDSTPKSEPASSLAMGDELKNETPAPLPTSGKKLALAKRRKRISTAPTNASRKSGRGDVATANKAMSVTTDATKAKQPAPAETYVTFIIEIPINIPASGPVAETRTRSRNVAQ
jgi:anti-sigma factor RsiW